MIILDTNVVSELMKPVQSAAVTGWLLRQPREDLFTTTVTIAEVLFGIELLPKGKRRDSLYRVAEATFSEDFAGRTLGFDEPPARLYALISAARPLQGRPISVQDALIAAIARSHNAVLATRDTGDFEGCGVRVVNPWEG